MKRLLLIVCALLMLLSASVSLCACDFATGDGGDYEVFDCMIVPALPSITNLLKELGEGASWGETWKSETVNATGTNYLICLCTGTPGANHLKEHLQFVLADGGRILYDEDYITIGKVSDYDIPNLSLQGAGKEPVEGIMIVPFELYNYSTGTLYINVVKDSDENGRSEVEPLMQIPVGEEVQGSAVVDVGLITIGYLSEKDYLNGGYDEASITDELYFEEGKPSYVVLDFDFSVLKDNDGDLSLSCHMCFPGQTTASVTLEEAATTNITKEENGDVLDVCTTYSVPATRGEQKSVRIILRLNEPDIATGGMHLIINGQSLVLSGNTHVPNMITAGGTSGEERPMWQRDTMPEGGKVALLFTALVLFLIGAFWVMHLLMASEWWEIIFPLLSTVLAVAAMAMLFFATTWVWWVVSIVGVAIYVVMMLSLIIAGKIVDNNAGEYWPLLFSPLTAIITFPIYVFLIPSWSWGMVLLIECVMIMGTAVLSVFWGDSL